MKLYFDGFSNEENENNIVHMEPVKGPILDVTEEEVRRAITSMIEEHLVSLALL